MGFLLLRLEPSRTLLNQVIQWLPHKAILVHHFKLELQGTVAFSRICATFLNLFAKLTCFWEKKIKNCSLGKINGIKAVSSLDWNGGDQLYFLQLHGELLGKRCLVTSYSCLERINKKLRAQVKARESQVFQQKELSSNSPLGMRRASRLETLDFLFA